MHYISLEGSCKRHLASKQFSRKIVKIIIQYSGYAILLHVWSLTFIPMPLDYKANCIVLGLITLGFVI